MKYGQLIGLAVSIVIFLTPAYAREFHDPLARRVTDFLPTYTPFIPPLPPDRYFPDEVGDQVADAIIDAYQENPVGVAHQVQELAQHDTALAAEGEQATGLTPYLYALAIPATEEDAEDIRVAELDGSPDELLADADTLLAKEKRNRFGRMFNWVLSTFDVGSLFFGTPRSPSPQSAQGIVSEVSRSGGPSPRERKALVLYREFLYRAPEHPRAPAVKKLVEKLEARRNKALLRAELAKAETALEMKDYWRANFHYQLALLVDEESARARDGLREVEKQLQQHADFIQSEAPDPMAGIRAAQWERSKATLAYVFPGTSFVKDNLVVAGTQIATEGLLGAATFGGLTLLQTGAKLWQVFAGHAISQQGVIDEGEKYLHTTPEAERSPEVYELLARAYKKEGRLDRAIQYYELSGEEDEVAALQEQAGKALLELAEKSAHQVEKETYLRTLVEEYPDTQAAHEAAPELRKLLRPEHRGLHFSKVFITENPDLFGPQGMGLKRELLDNDPANVELSDEGIRIRPGEEITMSFMSDEGPRTKVYRVPSTSWKQFWRRFREKGYEEAIEEGDTSLAQLAFGAEAADISLQGRQEKNRENGWRLLPYLTGSLSGTHVSMRGVIPREFLGTRLSFGRDRRSSFVGLEVPMPLIPVDFLFLGREGLPSLYPRIRLSDTKLKDEALYE